VLGELAGSRGHLISSRGHLIDRLRGARQSSHSFFSQITLTHATGALTVEKVMHVDRLANIYPSVTHVFRESRVTPVDGKPERRLRPNASTALDLGFDNPRSRMTYPAGAIASR